MGMFAFRRAKEREAASKVASTPVEAVKPKRKRKTKPKPKTYGNLDSSDGGSSERKQLPDTD